MKIGINHLVENILVGKHKHIHPDSFHQTQLKMGRKVEKEHSNDPKQAQEIAKDHLAEIPDYYTRLNKMEKRAELGKKY